MRPAGNSVYLLIVIFEKDCGKRVVLISVMDFRTFASGMYRIVREAYSISGPIELSFNNFLTHVNSSTAPPEESTGR